MTSTGYGSATATGTSPMCTIFSPMKLIMGGLVQIKSDTYVAWMGGAPSSDWTDLKISTADLQQLLKPKSDQDRQTDSRIEI